jgi:HD superfamily phosphodiesterase
VYTALVFGAALVASALTVWRSPHIGSVADVVLIVGLALFSGQRGVRLPNGAFASPGFMICMAGIVVFNQDHSWVGILLVGTAIGINLSSFTRRSWPWVPLNASISALAVLAAGLVFAALPDVLVGRLPWGLVGVVPTALAYGSVATVLFLFSYVFEDGHVPPEVVRGYVALFTNVLPFAALGYFLGRLYVSLGPSVMLLIIVPILIAREMFASYMRVRESHDETVGMLIHALEAKDRYTSGHSERVADYARYIGEELNFMPARLERLRFAALMHDIGKLVVPNQLLNKAGRLTPEEFAQVRVHEKVSVQMLSHIDFLRPIAAASHSDNTRFDPDDPDHPIEPYIVMIADAYDAMTSTRSYRKALAQRTAFQELRDRAGVQFHPACVEALIHAVEKRGEHHGDGFEREAAFDDAPAAGVGSAGLGDLEPEAMPGSAPSWKS